ncbi:MAG: SMP-30/gluconolactonase/LRE family protein [Acidimicrobiales bacterium]|nr:SMP-30/gluconolactonase/LRE family protein [Acidimicrobiales bacterium]
MGDPVAVGLRPLLFGEALMGLVAAGLGQIGELERIDERIELPLEKPSMPAFGGPDLATMYVTTIGAAGGTPSAPGRDGFVPGSLLAVDGLGVTGVADPVYAG